LDDILAWFDAGEFAYSWAAAAIALLDNFDDAATDTDDGNNSI